LRKVEQDVILWIGIFDQLNLILQKLETSEKSLKMFDSMSRFGKADSNLSRMKDT
jgi:hypothetical protein